MCATMYWSNPDKASAFAKFKRRCQHLFKSYYKKIADDEKVIYILLWLGDEGDEIFQSFTWSNTETDSNDPEKVFEKFETYFMPVTTHRLFRYQLMNMKQGSQPVDAFVTDMKTVAMKCKFRDTEETEDRMLDQLIWGCTLQEAQKLLIGKDSKLKLDEAVNLIRTHEATRQQMESLNIITPTSVNAVRQTQHTRRGRGGQYGNHSASGSRRENECYHCGKIGHWANECYQKRRDQSSQRRESSNSDNPPWRGRGRGRVHRGQRGRGRRGRGRSRSRNRNVHSTEEGAEDMSPHADLDQFQYLSLDSIEINPIGAENDSRTQIFAKVKVWKIDKKKVIDIRCKVDTGAEGNIMPLTYFRKIYPELLDAEGNPQNGAIKENKTILSAYGGTQIKNVGQVEIPCSYGETKFTGKFFVADVTGPIILGLNTSRALKLVTLHCAIVTESVSDQSTESKRKDNKKTVRFTDGAVGAEERRSGKYIKSDTPLDERPAITKKDDLKEMYPECFDNSESKPRYFGITLDQSTSGTIHAPRRVPLELKDRLKTKLDSMEKNEVIAKVSQPTDWVNSLVIREKPNGDLRICLDPTDLNKAMKRPHYPTPTVEEIAPKFAGAKIFSKLDAKDGYWNIRLDEKSSLLTTFNTPFGRYKFLKLPFGLKASQDVFQQLMDETYLGCKGAAGIADDIQVYGKDGKEHDVHLHETLERTRQAGIKLNFEKCQVKQKSVKFFGNIYSEKGVEPDPGKVEAIKNIDAPHNKADLHTFLGLVNYLRQYVPNLSHHTGPLRELLKEDVEFQWTESHQEVFNKLKELITTATTLRFYDRNKPVTLQVDASTKGLGAVLMQDGNPVAYASKSLTETESRYANIERELLAVVFGCTRFHTYLYGRTFTIESDHKPLAQIDKKNLTKAPPRLQRMLMQLQPYTYELIYKPGKQVVIADALSRLSPSECEEIPGLEVYIHEMVTVSHLRMTELKNATETDANLQLLKKTVLEGWPSHIKALPPEIRPYWSVQDDVYVHDGLILMGQRIIIPETQRHVVMSQIHSAHQGATKCKLRAKSAVWWPGIYADIDKTVAACPTCQATQNSQPKEPIIVSEIPPRPWHTIGADLFHVNGQWYVLVTDYYSKFPFIRRLSSLKTQAEKAAMMGIFSEHGIPEKLICDNGSQLVSQEYQNFASSLGMTLETSSPEYPRGHGLVERHVQTVKKLIIKCIHSGSDIAMSMLILRSTPLSHTLASPAELLTGRKFRTDLPTKVSAPFSREYTAEQMVNAQNLSAEYYNQNTRALPELVPGQRIRVQDQRSKMWSPARVIEQASTPRSYIIKKDDGGIIRRNRQHLKPIPEKQQSPTSITKKPDMNNSFLSEPAVYMNQTAQENNKLSRSPANEQTAGPSRSGYTTRSGRQIVEPRRLLTEY